MNQTFSEGYQIEQYPLRASSLDNKLNFDIVQKHLLIRSIENYFLPSELILWLYL
jgi:hypothetical protein